MCWHEASAVSFHHLWMMMGQIWGPTKMVLVSWRLSWLAWINTFQSGVWGKRSNGAQAGVCWDLWYPEWVKVLPAWVTVTTQMLWFSILHYYCILSFIKPHQNKITTSTSASSLFFFIIQDVYVTSEVKTTRSNAQEGLHCETQRIYIKYHLVCSLVAQHKSTSICCVFSDYVAALKRMILLWHHCFKSYLCL